MLSGAATRGALLALWLLPEQTCGFGGLSYLKSQLDADVEVPERRHRIDGWGHNT